MNLKKIERLSKKVYMVCPNCSRKKLVDWHEEYWCINCYSFFSNYLIEGKELNEQIIEENIELSQDLPIKERKLMMERVIHRLNQGVFDMVIF